MISIMCSCGYRPLHASIVRRPDEVKDLTGGDADVVFSIECTGCKAQTFFEFFTAKDKREKDRVVLTHKSGGTCTKDPNTCSKMFCDWPKCGH